MASYDTVQEAAGRVEDKLKQEPKLNAKFYTTTSGTQPLDPGAKKLIEAMNSVGGLSSSDQAIIVNEIASGGLPGHEVHTEPMDGGTAITITPKP